ncbi:MAG: hypothetical protein ACK4ND_10805 [Cytophagaceae bacterium]
MSTSNQTYKELAIPYFKEPIDCIEGLPQNERLGKLNAIAIQQMKILVEAGNRKFLKSMGKKIKKLLIAGTLKINRSGVINYSFIEDVSHRKRCHGFYLKSLKLYDVKKVKCV